MEHSSLPNTEAGSQDPSVLPEIALTVVDSFSDGVAEALQRIGYPHQALVTDDTQIPDTSVQRDTYQTRTGNSGLPLSTTSSCIEDQNEPFHPATPHAELVGQHAVIPAVSGNIANLESVYTGYVWDGRTSLLSRQSSLTADSLPPYQR
jgi:hypothetical protein